MTPADLWRELGQLWDLLWEQVGRVLTALWNTPLSLYFDVAWKSLLFTSGLWVSGAAIRWMVAATRGWWRGKNKAEKDEKVPNRSKEDWGELFFQVWFGIGGFWLLFRLMDFHSGAP